MSFIGFYRGYFLRAAAKYYWGYSTFPQITQVSVKSLGAGPVER